MPPVRRLTAILAADVAGYSRLMGADEEGTHERLKAHLGELVEPKISQQSRRVSFYPLARARSSACRRIRHAPHWRDRSAPPIYKNGSRVFED
jgi:hypothetical protein